MTFRHRPYTVMSGYMWERKEAFAHFFPALLVFVTRYRENEAGCRASIINRFNYDESEDKGVRWGLSDSELYDIQEYTP